MPNQLSRRDLLAALVAAVPSAALAKAVGAQTAPATPPPPAPITGPQLAAPPTDLKPPYPEAGKVNRLDPRLDVLIDADAKVEKICDGFLHAEGPVWVGGNNGYLLVSDTQVNHIVKWSPKEGRSVWLEPGPTRPGPTRLVHADHRTRQRTPLQLQSAPRRTRSRSPPARRPPDAPPVALPD